MPDEETKRKPVKHRWRSASMEKYHIEVRRQTLLDIFQYQVENKCTLSDAIAAVSNISERTFYNWVSSGIIDDDLDQVRRGRVTALQEMAASSMSEVIRYQIDIATGRVNRRNASPTAAAKFLWEIARTYSGEEEKEKEEPKPTLVFMPQFARFVFGSDSGRDKDGFVIEGECEEIPARVEKLPASVEISAAEENSSGPE